MSDKHAIRLALLCALAGGALLYTYLARLEHARTGGRPQAVLSLARDAPEGTRIDRALLTARELPESFVESRHIPQGKLEQLLGARTLVALRAGESLLWSDIAELGTGRRKLAELVAPGMRAITINARSLHSSALMQPGDRVDVLFTGRLRDGGDVTRTLLQGVMVLAVGANTGEPGAPDHTAGGREITLGVDVTGAQLLAHAQSRGELRVALRNPDDVHVLEGQPDVTSLEALSARARPELAPGRESP